MKQSKQAEVMIKLMDTVDEMIVDPDSVSGPGSVKRKTKNDYSVSQVKDLLSYASKFIGKGKQPSSWKGDYQSWLNAVGKGMEQFKSLKKGDPALTNPTDGSDINSRGYKPNK